MTKEQREAVESAVGDEHGPGLLSEFAFTDEKTGEPNEALRAITILRAMLSEPEPSPPGSYRDAAGIVHLEPGEKSEDLIRAMRDGPSHADAIRRLKAVQAHIRQNRKEYDERIPIPMTGLPPDQIATWREAGQWADELAGVIRLLEEGER